MSVVSRRHAGRSSSNSATARRGPVPHTGCHATSHGTPDPARHVAQTPSWWHRHPFGGRPGCGCGSRLCALGSLWKAARRRGRWRCAATGWRRHQLGRRSITGRGTRMTPRGIWPATPSDARPEPLGTPGPKLSSSTDYVFMRTVSEEGDRPVAWDPCRPIHLVLNNAASPPGADALVREAVASVHSETGLQFVLDGATTETQAGGRGPLETSR